MNSLVDYGSSSSSSTSDSEEEKSLQEKANDKTKLPTPALSGSQCGLNNSVFSNPFAQAELAKAAILEKHVKMVPGKKDLQMINGKKVCWNFRKGRCRFGHNCKYAHDTDIQRTPEEILAEKEKTKAKSIVCEESGTQSSGPPPHLVLEEEQKFYDDAWEGSTDRQKKKRPGLSQTLVPGKKVLKMYKEQKLKDTRKK